MKPQIKPMTVPLSMDCTNRLRGLTAAMLSLVVITGRRMNLMPRSRVMKVEKPPMVVLGTRLDT